MKKYITSLAVFILWGLQVNAQLNPVQKRGVHPYGKIKEWIMKANNDTSKQYRALMIKWINESQDSVVFTERNIPWILATIRSEEVNLTEGGYMNTGVNLRSKLTPFLGHDYGPTFCGVANIGSYKIPVWIDNCINLIKMLNLIPPTPVKPPVVAMMPPPVSATPAPSTPQAEKKKFPPIKEKPAEKQTQVIVVQQPSRTNVNVNVDVWGMVSYWLRPRYQQQQQRIPIVERRFDQNQQDIIQPRSDQNQQDRIQRRIDQN